MKVNIGPYTKWIGPYQLAEKIPFVSEDTRWKIGEYLSNTWVNDVCNWVDSKKRRKIKVVIHDYDTWNMDHTLALIILPMLKQIQATKHGSPMVDDEDVPEHMRHTSIGPDDPVWADDNWVHYKWEWVLNEMIWCFEQWVDDERDVQFYDEGLSSEACRDYYARLYNGFRLFGKYYANLWD